MKKLGLEPLPDHGAHVLQTRFVTRHLTPAGYWVSRPYEVLTTSQFLAALGEGGEAIAQDERDLA